MKNLVLPGAAAVALLSLAVAGMTPLEEEIARRLQPVGEVCLQGEACADGAAASASAPASVAGNSPADVYNQACIACHAAGVAGAPRFGIAEDWTARIAKGKEQLYASVINGMPPAMPAKGMCFACSDAELRAVTDYMLAELE